jgi:hypothetical protein
VANKPKRLDTNYLGQHHEFFGDVTPIQSNELEKGMVTRFLYKGKERVIFIIAGTWKGKVHGLDLKHIPRRPFLTVVNAPEVWSEQKLYDMRINTPMVKPFDAYRTFDRGKIGSLKKVFYDSSLQPTETGEQELEQPDQMTAFDHALGEGI